MVKHTVFYLQSDEAPSKRAILRAALSLFATRGIAATSVREIARKAGYTNPALYKFFEGKMELASCLFDRCYAHLQSEVTVAVGHDDRPLSERITSLVAAYVRLLDEELDAVVYVHEALRLFWNPEAGKGSVFSIVRSLIANAVKRGEVAAEADPALLATVTLGALAQFARSVQYGEISSPASAHAQALEAAIRGAVGLG